MNVNFLEPIEIVLSNFQLAKVLRDYIPLALHQYIADGRSFDANNPEAFIQKVLDNSKLQLRMYGSAEELAADLTTYSEFVGRLEHFGFDVCLPAASLLQPFRSHSLDEYFNRAGLSEILQTVTRQHYEKEMSVEFMSMILRAYCKLWERQLNCAREFLPLNFRLLKTIKRSFLAMMPMMIEKVKEKTSNVCFDCTPTQMFHNFMRSSSISFYVLVDLETAYLSFVAHFAANTSSNKGEEYRKLFNFLEAVVTSISIIHHPNNLRKQFDSIRMKQKVTLRVFEDEFRTLVMCDEVEDALNELNGVVGQTKSLEEKILKAIDFNDLLKKYEGARSIECIRVPMKRTRQAVAPIKSVYGYFCKPSADLFFELFRDTFFGFRLFQKVEKTDWHEIQTCFDELVKKYFMPNEPEIYFLPTETLKSIEINLFAPLKSKYEHKQAKYVRNAKLDGFTVEFLKEELELLKLTEHFPRIADYADMAHAEVSRVKKSTVLRTCDLYDAIEHCLLPSFLERFPELAKFLHIQFACDRVLGLRCIHCLAISSDSHKNSKWIHFQSAKMEKDEECLDAECLRLSNCTRIYKNTSVHKLALAMYCMDDPNDEGLFTKGSERKVTRVSFDGTFLLNETEKHLVVHYVEQWMIDVDYSGRCMSEPLDLTFLENLTNFSNWLYKSQLYLRTVFFESEPECLRVFAEEALEMLPILLKRQQKYIRRPLKKIEEYRRKWAAEAGYYTISLDELEECLEALDINKRELTLVPDINWIAVHTIKNNKMPFVVSPKMTKSLAVNHFMSVYFKSLIHSDNVVKLSDDSSFTIHNTDAAFTIFQALRKNSFVDIEQIRLPATTEIPMTMIGLLHLPNKSWKMADFIEEFSCLKMIRLRFALNLEATGFQNGTYPNEVLRIVSVAYFLLTFVKVPEGEKNFVLEEFCRAIPAVKHNGTKIIVFSMKFTATSKTTGVYSLKGNIHLENENCADWRAVNETDKQRMVGMMDVDPSPFLMMAVDDNVQKSTIKIIIPVAEVMQNLYDEVTASRAENQPKKGKTSEKGRRRKEMGDLSDEEVQEIVERWNQTSLEFHRKVTAEITRQECTERRAVFAPSYDDVRKCLAKISEPEREYLKSKNVSDEAIDTLAKGIWNGMNCAQQEYMVVNMKEEENERLIGKKIKEAKSKISKLLNCSTPVKEESKEEHDNQVSSSTNGSTSSSQLQSSEGEQDGIRSNPNTLNKSKQQAKKPSVSQSTAPQQPESKVCEKCVRTSDICMQVKQKLKKSTKEVKDLEKELNNTRKQLENAHKTQKELEMKDKRIRELEEMLEQQSRKMNEMKIKKRKVETLEEEVVQFSIKCAKMEDTIRSLTANQPSSAPSTSARSEHSSEMKNVLAGIKDNLHFELEANPVAEAIKKVENLRSLTEDETSRRFAGNELAEFQQSHQNYMKVLMENIKKIESSVEIAETDLLDLPEFPTFSSSFTALYERALRVASLEECPICLSKMDPTTTQLVKCGNCRNGFCEKCAENWSQNSNNCPTCRGPITDFVLQ
ncbi:unnamed protein product [Caenorhabditis sp. 36 PRJEB53466]|nr:unnamed protein product [Caenorhabditis sp. 36 PRJEB53466]